MLYYLNVMVNYYYQSENRVITRKLPCMVHGRVYVYLGVKIYRKGGYRGGAVGRRSEDVIYKC